MAILDTALDPRAPAFLAQRTATLQAVSALEVAHLEVCDGGGERAVTRHHARGKLLPRERIELVIDRDTALLELAATAGREPGAPGGSGVVLAIGLVEQAECVLLANDATVRDGELTAAGRRKVARAVELAQRYRLPLLALWESTSELFDLVAPSPPAPPVLCVVFGQLGKVCPIADYTIAVPGSVDPDGAGPSTADAVADDERQALRLLRQAVRHLAGGAPAPRWPAAVPAPRMDGDDLVALGAGRDDVYELLGRVLDGSEFDELRPHQGSEVVAGFGAVHGYPVAILGIAEPKLTVEAAGKGIALVRLAERGAIPIVVVSGSADNGAGPDLHGPLIMLARALLASCQHQIALRIGAQPGRWMLPGYGLRFVWAAAECGEDDHDGVIDPRDTRTVLGICLSAGGRTSPAHIAAGGVWMGNSL